jgi:hypothetical protein
VATSGIIAILLSGLIERSDIERSKGRSVRAPEVPLSMWSLVVEVGIPPAAPKPFVGRATGCARDN